MSDSCLLFQHHLSPDARGHLGVCPSQLPSVTHHTMLSFAPRPLQMLFLGLELPLPLKSIPTHPSSLSSNAPPVKGLPGPYRQR